MLGNTEQPNSNPHKNKVHKYLVHSYSWYFLFFLVGISLDVSFPLKIFDSSYLVPIGFILTLFATILIFWAQKSSRKLNIENLSKETFSKGPYKYMRNPTHLGLLLLLFGFGIMANALFLVIFTFIYAVIDRLIFLKKQDAILELKYGEPFVEYKKSVKLKF